MNDEDKLRCRHCCFQLLGRMHVASNAEAPAACWRAARVIHDLDMLDIGGKSVGEPLSVALLASFRGR